MSYLTGLRRYTTVAARSGERSFVERASASTGGSGGRPSATVATVAKNYQVGLLDGFVDTVNQRSLHAIYREMFYLDAISGAWVELMSNMPFSDFSLSGVKNRKVLEKNMESLDRLRLKILLPQISMDYLAMGAFLGTLNWNSSDRLYDSIMPQDIDAAVLTPVPELGANPLVDITISKEMAKRYQPGSPQYARLQRMLPAAVLQQLAEAKTIPVEPDNLLYIPRRTLSTRLVGTSALHRLIPIWMMEKPLMRGTIEQAFSRRRAIKHITISSTDEWEPGTEDYNTAAQLFLSADIDPDNSVVVTPDGVNVNELAQGGEFWKWTDVSDSYTTIKMKALGTNEGFLSGDASYSTVDASMSVFVENMRAYRGMLTREVFYDRIFPRIAEENGFRAPRHSATETAAVNDPRQFVVYSDDESRARRRAARLETPTIVWHKRLEPEGDSGYLDMLNNLSDRGLPVTLRVMAAASSQNMDDILGGYDQDVEDRKRVYEYTQRVKQYNINPQQQAGGDDEVTSALANLVSRPGVTKRGLLARAQDFSPDVDVVETHKSGRPRKVSSARRRRHSEEVNRNIVAVARDKRLQGVL